MTLDQFKKNGGEIAIHLLPNGFNTKNGIKSCSFSLIIGLNSENNETKENPEIPIDPKAFFKEIAREINAFSNSNNSDSEISGLTIDSGDPKVCYKIPAFDIFSDDKLKNWEKLLDEEGCFIQFYSSDLGSAAKTINDGIAVYHPHLFDLDHSSARPLFKNENITAKRSVNKLSSIAERSSLAIEKDILERELNYNAIDESARITAQMLLSINNSKGTEQKYDFISLVNMIFQHPEMSEYFGLMSHFNVPITDKFMQDYYLKANAGQFKQVRLTSNYSSKFIATTKELDSIYSWVSLKKEKYYHGLENYGLMPYSSDSFEFRTTSPDNNLQNEKLLKDAFTKAENENRSLVEFADLQPSKMEGIYLIQKAQANTLVKFLDDANDKLSGIIGQSVSVLIKNTKKKIENSYSLCKRVAKYDLADSLLHKRREEEGWLHTNIVSLSTKGNFNSQTIFHWTGYNLAVPKGGLSPNNDQKISKQDAKTKGGFFGFLTKDEGNILKNKGFTYSYEYIDEGDTQLKQLAEGQSYSFIIKNVLSNGSTLKHKPQDNSDIEITLEDLIDTYNKDLEASELNDKLFNCDLTLFNPNQQVINPPHFLVPNGALVNSEVGETDTHIVLMDKKDALHRFVFPPRIDMQFAHNLGLLSPEVLEAKDVEEYKTKGNNIVGKAINIVPEKPKNDTVNYLADPRGKYIMVTPANWITRNYLQQPFVGSSEEFFSILAKGDLYKNLKAGRIEIQSNDENTVKFEINEQNVLNAHVGPGLQLKFNVQLRDHVIDLKNLNEQFKLMDLHYGNFKNKLNYSIIDHYKYPKTQFHFTSAISRPGQPNVIKNPAHPPFQKPVERPTKLTDLSRIFCVFSLTNSYNRAVSKQLQFLADSNYLLDDGITIPEIIDHNQWENENTGKKLLENEYPSSVFLKQKSITEPNVYKNNFGFTGQFTAEMLDTALLSGEAELVHFNVGNGYSITLKKKRKENQEDRDLWNLCLNGNIIIPDNAIESSKLFIVNLKYSLLPNPYNQGATALALTISFNSKVKIIYDVTLLPFNDLSEKNISLLPKAEQKLLSIQSKSIAYFKFNYKDEYFYYKSEDSAGYLRKKVVIQSVSNFQNFFPNQKSISDPSELFTLEIQNNVKPAMPEFQITPLLYHEEEYGNIYITKKRSMRLMFEIERPLKNNEKFALIIQNITNKIPHLDKDTCAIGRDLTTLGADFLSATKPSGISLDEFILKKESPYLDKYHAGITTVIIPSGTYRVMLFEPYFEFKKNKWIAVIGLDQNLLKILSGSQDGKKAALNAYNPFLKIIAAKFVSESTSDINKISNFTKPKYINVLTERGFSVRENQKSISVGTPPQTKPINVWDVKILNKTAKKTSLNTHSNTVSLICLREKTFGFLGEIVQSRSIIHPKGKIELGPLQKFQILGDEEIISVYKEQNINVTICVYEFELFGNSPDISNIENWFDESTARLVYAEEF